MKLRIMERPMETWRRCVERNRQDWTDMVRSGKDDVGQKEMEIPCPRAMMMKKMMMVTMTKMMIMMWKAMMMFPFLLHEHADLK